jgi:uncharacterized protein YkwD
MVLPADAEAAPGVDALSVLGGVCKLATLTIVAACLLVAPAGAAPQAQASRIVAANSLESAVLVQVNGLRARHGLRPLRLSARLAAAADSHSRAMVARGFFAHQSVDGTAFWKRVKRWYGSGGYEYWAVGENLLWASPEVSAERALAMWLESPPHRKNLLTARWREIGLSAVHVDSAPGVFKGLEVTVITADFGVRS